MVAGYLSEAYAHTFTDRGSPTVLQRSGGWVVLRPTPDDSEHRDAMGLYPLLACRNWDGLPEDLSELDEGVVSVVAVVDPLGAHTPKILAAAFPDLVRPFKRHFVVDRDRPRPPLPTNHRRNLKRAARVLEVEIGATPAQASADWVRLYGALTHRHGIEGAANFSAAALESHLRVPGARIVRALRGEETVAMQVWFVHGATAYYHLGASNEQGYVHRASFALFEAAIRDLEPGVRRLDLGGGPGAKDQGDGGLVRFKRPWANEERTAMLCGRVAMPDVYARLAQGRPTTFFPAYRSASGGAT